MATTIKQCSGKKVTIVVDFILTLTVGLPAFYLFLQATPHKLGFFCHDKSLSYPYKEDTISTTSLVAIGLTISSFLVILVEVLNCCDTKHRKTCLTTETLAYCTKRYIMFLIGIAVQLLIVEIIKNMMGSLRPNFFDVCKPAYNSSLCPGYITQYTCIGGNHTAKEIRSSRQAFPSGHSSFSMYIAAFFCLYIQRRLTLTWSVLLKVMLQVSLITLSILCSVGRIRDHQHHTSDVIAGLAIGFAVAVAMHRAVLENKENQNGSKTFLTDSENSTIQCDSLVTRDAVYEEDSSAPTSLLVNEKQPNARTETIPYVKGCARDIDNTCNMINGDCQEV